ncbi:MAG: DUF4065 domain-containing protein [Christensenellaceae bacterium]|jgi:uncharacterized phage-associated protein|nr:DUF4065 domain-containing protein [Christensenellaceae bacterium]
MYKADDIANWFIVHGVDDVGFYGGEYVTPLKLQKLLYYAQGCHGVLKGMKLFDEDFYHWTYGPAIPEIYDLYKKHGDHGIERPSRTVSIDDETRAVLNEVYKVFGKFSAWALCEMTHEEAPWKNTKMGEVIPYANIIEYFSKEVVEK